MNVIRVTTGIAIKAKSLRRQVFRKMYGPRQIHAMHVTSEGKYSWMLLSEHIQIALQERASTMVSSTMFCKKGIELSFDRKGI